MNEDNKNTNNAEGQFYLFLISLIAEYVEQNKLINGTRPDIIAFLNKNNISV